MSSVSHPQACCGPLFPPWRVSRRCPKPSGSRSHTWVGMWKGWRGRMGPTRGFYTVTGWSQCLHPWSSPWLMSLARASMGNNGDGLGWVYWGETCPHYTTLPHRTCTTVYRGCKGGWQPAAWREVPFLAQIFWPTSSRGIFPPSQPLLNPSLERKSSWSHQVLQTQVMRSNFQLMGSCCCVMGGLRTLSSYDGQHFSQAQGGHMGGGGVSETSQC